MECLSFFDKLCVLILRLVNPYDCRNFISYLNICMKNLLITAYYFPPSGGPGVQRVLKHVKYLPEFGWKPHVLTVSNGDFPARDESLLKEIPDNVYVRRTKIYEPYMLYRLLTGRKPGSAIDVNVIKKENQKIGIKDRFAELIRSTFFIPDARIGWLATARKAVREIINQQSIDAVYSSSPPYTCSLIGRYAKKRFGLPWIAGFRDPWTEFISSPKRWFLPAMIDKIFEKSVFTTADAVECAWEGIIKDALSKYPDLNVEKFYHVPNGFDSADYPFIEEKKNEKFTITYTGSMYGRRNPSAFFEALEILIKNKLIELQKFKLKFIGRFGDEVHNMFQSVSFRNSIEVINYMPHKESIIHLMTSDALLLVVDESKESNEIVPGKVYEYMGTKKPVLAIAPKESAIDKLMKETKAGLVAHQTELQKIADNILIFYNDWFENKKSIMPNTDVINSYERKEAARTLANILNTICGG